MPKRSAGILIYRERSGSLEFLLVHPGGPFWAKRDQGAWSIPKGEYSPQEDALEAAVREFEEETGLRLCGPFLPLRRDCSGRRENRCSVGGQRRFRSYPSQVQHIHDRMAVAERTHSGLSGSRPGGVAFGLHVSGASSSKRRLAAFSISARCERLFGRVGRRLLSLDVSHRSRQSNSDRTCGAPNSLPA
jgi:hypothetical protein